MSKKLTQSFAIALALLSSSGFAATKNIDIKANIVGTCAFVNADAITLDFGSLTEGTAPSPQEAKAQFWCTKGTTVNLTANEGANAVSSQMNLKSTTGDTELIPYALTLSKASEIGAGKSNPIELTVNATMEATAADSKPAGDYSDTVTLTLLP
ncbi:spore coat protein U domain-containing protein [uncultured Deefgea sp.]|uniref:spore coat protein U domain-containing protein n=1 Tax=uncultured Deefgea sp. TaxID=1304914 RepID=UPI0026161E6C|nr:spore coat protein U domain-containing protein [uncultured Deefgea sp.]